MRAAFTGVSSSSTHNRRASPSRWIGSQLLLLCLTALSCASQPTDTLRQSQLAAAEAAAAASPILAEAAAPAVPEQVQTRHRCFLGKCKPDMHETIGQQDAQRIASAASRALVGEQLAAMKAGETQNVTCPSGTGGGMYKVGYWTQQLDHQNTTDDTWQQHFQLQDRFFWGNESESLVFLMVGGEGRIEEKWVCNEGYTYMAAAAEHRALVIQLEHRYFGFDQSDHMNNYRTQKLEFLTVEQALADLQVFIRDFPVYYNLTNPKFVLFGGSYPATLTALSRQQNPDLTVGGIASSAPLTPVVDFYHYARVMEFVFDDYSKECYDAIKSAFSLMYGSLFTPANRTMLYKKLNFRKPFDDAGANGGVLPTWENLHTVSSEIFSAFQGMVQYTYDGRDPENYKQAGVHKNVDYTCKVMTNSSYDPIDALYQIYKVSSASDVNDLTYKPHVANDFNKVNEPLRATRLSDDKTNENDIWGRGWMYLSCMQFGWLQTTTGSDLFGQVVPLDYYELMCKDLFDIKFNDANIQATANKYGDASTFTATNLYLSNGNYDPWSSLGFYNSSDEKRLYSHVTASAAHVSDFYPPYKGEPSSLVGAREILNKHLIEYAGATKTGPQQPGKPNQGGADPGNSQSTTPKSSAMPATASLFALFSTLMLLFTRL